MQSNGTSEHQEFLCVNYANKRTSECCVKLGCRSLVLDNCRRSSVLQETPTSTRSSSRRRFLPAPEHRRPSPAPQKLRHLQDLPVATGFFLHLSIIGLLQLLKNSNIYNVFHSPPASSCACASSPSLAPQEL